MYQIVLTLSKPQQFCQANAFTHKYLGGVSEELLNEIIDMKSIHLANFSHEWLGANSRP